MCIPCDETFHTTSIIFDLILSLNVAIFNLVASWRTSLSSDNSCFLILQLAFSSKNFELETESPNTKGNVSDSGLDSAENSEGKDEQKASNAASWG